MDKKLEMSKYYKFGLYLVILILINLVALNLFFRIDLTTNRLYSLSRASKTAVSTLKEPLTINVFFSQNLPAPYNNIERYLHDLLEEYAIHGKRFFSYRFFDVSAKEGDLSDKAENNVALDPIFDPADDDWHLSDSSPVVVKEGGDDSLAGMPDTDKDGNPRTIPWSMGAYEQDS